MAGMLQIITYLLSLYLVIKGIEILQIALASNREHRGGIILIGILTLAVCVVAALGFSWMQDQQAKSMSQSRRRTVRSSKPCSSAASTSIPSTPVIADLKFVEIHRSGIVHRSPGDTSLERPTWRRIVGPLIGDGSARKGITVDGDASSQKGTLWLVESAASASLA